MISKTARTTIAARMEELADGFSVAKEHHHGIVSFSQRVNLPVGPSSPSRARRTGSRAPSSTVRVPACAGFEFPASDPPPLDTLTMRAFGDLALFKLCWQVPNVPFVLQANIIQ